MLCAIFLIPTTPPSPEMQMTSEQGNLQIKRLIRTHLNHVILSPPSTTHPGLSCRPPLRLMRLPLRQRHRRLSFPLHHLQHTPHALLPGIQARGHLAPLLLAKHAVGRLVHKEHLLLLRELALHESGTDHVNDPHLDIFGGDLERLGNALVFEFAGRCACRQGCEGEESHLTVQLAVVETFALDEAIVLVSEVVVILEFLLSNDLEQLGVHGMGVAEGLDGAQGGQVVEVEVRVREERGFEGAEGEGLGIGGGVFFGCEGAEGTKDVLV
jgi:hypothetical protein